MDRTPEGPQPQRPSRAPPPPAEPLSEDLASERVPTPSASVQKAKRDERIDFIRGIVMFILVIVHTEIISLFTFAVWERVGLISGGEGFVILAGVVVGMVSRSRLAKGGWQLAAGKLFERAAQLYRVNIAVMAVVLLLSLVPFLNVKEIMTFTDRFAHQTYPLFPPAAEGFYQFVGRILLLRAGPHQIQILGLYVVLMSATPLALWLLVHRRTGVLLTVSLALYFLGKMENIRLTGANFENAFPLLDWQLIYFLGLAAGYHRDHVMAFFKTTAGKATFALCVVLVLGFCFLAQNTPNPVVPDWSRLHLIPAEKYESLRATWFDKNTMGIGRVVNYLAALVVGYALLGRFWPFFSRAFGWFFVPLGQASLYVFIVHVFVVMLVSNFRPFTFDATRADILVNTVIHAAELMLLWAMVRYKVLFRWIPR